MPEWRHDLGRRLSSLHLPPDREAAIIDELAQHLEDHYRELIAGGASPAEAERLALADFQPGNVLANYIATLRLAVPPPPAPAAPARHLPAALWQDLKYAARSLRTQPGFVAVTMLTLALGIGANSAIFALVDVTLLRPLPLPDAGQLVAVSERTPAMAESTVSAVNMLDWATRTRTFAGFGGTPTNVASMVMANADGSTETISRQWATHTLFDVLGVTPVQGRSFVKADDVQRIRSVVLAESFWRTRFHADPAVVGSKLQLDGDSWLVVGVVPDAAQVVGRTSIWALRNIENVPPTDRGRYWLRSIGRMKPGVTIDEARADLDRVAADLAREYPATNAGRGVTIVPFRETIIGRDLVETSTLFLIVVGVVLLICCTNIASLLLTRTLARRRELALRAALGASRFRLSALVLTEGLMLAGGGGALGLGLALMILRAAPAVVPEGLLPPGVSLALDGRVVGFGVVVALVSAALFGLLPAWQATSAATPLTSTRVTGGGMRVRQWLVAGQVATAVTVLIGAGLLTRTLFAVANVDRGYRADQVLTMMVDPPGLPSVLAFYEEIEANVRPLPGVKDLAWATTLPLGLSYFGEVTVEVDGVPMPAGDRPVADYQVVSDTYFRALDLEVKAGRGFDSRDVPDGHPVCMVNEAYAQRHLSDRTSLGARLTLRDASSSRDDGTPCEVIGVVTQVKGRPDERQDLLQVYMPLSQNPVGDVFLLVRAESGEAAALTGVVRQAIAKVDTTKQTSVRDVQTLDDVLQAATSRHRFRAWLVAAFAALALTLAMVGVFGAFAHAVQHRVREFGVRRALGASTADVLGLVAGGALRVIAAGAVAGLLLSVWVGQALSTMLFGVEALDVLTFAGVTVLIAVSAVVALAAPSWRASRVDPIVALRNE